MKRTLAMVGAGAAAVVTWVMLQFWVNNPANGTLAFLDSGWIRLITGIVFFGVLIALGRGTFEDEDRPAPVVYKDDFAPGKTPLETSDAMARVFSGVTDDASRRRAIREWLEAIPQLTVLIPLAFYLRFGFIGPLGWGLTVFFDVYCLLWVIGLYFRPRTEYHSPVALRGDWSDRIGAFWLVSCAFGPLFGWIVMQALPITPNSWQWLYGLRVILAAGLPILTALPLLRYVRGKATLIALPLLVVITLLPVWTSVNESLDLWEGPVMRQSELYLPHTQRSLAVNR